jgi:hypothetical protein
VNIKFSNRNEDLWSKAVPLWDHNQCVGHNSVGMQ